MNRSRRRAIPLAALLMTASCRGGHPDGHETHGQGGGQGVGPVAAIAADPHAGHAGHGVMDSGPGAIPMGYVSITIDASRVAGLGFATVPVEERDFTKVLRTVGVVAPDETRSAHVHAKVRGWIDGILVNFVGKNVKAGEPLCSIYSQEVYAAELEFLSILDSTKNRPIAPGEFAEAEKHAEGQLLDAARRRLSLWDVPKSEIERLESTREPRRTFPLLAPRAGVVVAKEAIEGMYVDPSLELYTLSDLSRLWVLADVYEADVPYVHVGDKARLSVEGRETPIDASVAFLYPTINEPTRTLKVRFALDNDRKSAAPLQQGNQDDGRLRPGAFVSVAIDLPIPKGLAIPESAVIRTGARSIVFVAHGEHGEHLVPREITLGPLVGDRYRVDAGLALGEQVATGAQFLLDSESRLRATSSPPGGHVH